MHTLVVTLSAGYARPLVKVNRGRFNADKGFRAAALGCLLSYRFRENGDTRLLGDAEDCR